MQHPTFEWVDGHINLPDTDTVGVSWLGERYQTNALLGMYLLT